MKTSLFDLILVKITLENEDWESFKQRVLIGQWKYSEEDIKDLQQQLIEDKLTEPSMKLFRPKMLITSTPGGSLTKKINI